jgi:NAD(P)-dependent dehydrogenase (short-subunit alcohol dehydrogenase family)
MGKADTAMSLFDLADKVVVITGASKGIGRAIAERMAQHGARVVVSSRDRAACEEVARGIGARGGQALVQPCHIGHKQQLQALVDAALATWGRIDGVVCNAAVNPYYGPAIDVSDEVFDRIMGYNVRSNFWLCNMVLPHMAAAGGGSIILISSIGGLQGNDRIGVYAISKAAEMQLARNIALEWGHAGIRANCIAPGLVRTDFARAIWENPDSRARAEAQATLGRIGEPDDIAGAAVFLASPAGSFMTGQTMVIDGGRLAGGRVAAGGPDHRPPTRQSEGR